MSAAATTQPSSITDTTTSSKGKRQATPSTKRKEADEAVVAAKETQPSKRAKQSDVPVPPAAAAAAGEDEGEERAKHEKRKPPKTKPETREKLCLWRSAQQNAKPIGKESDPLQITPVLELVPTKGTTLTIRPGDIVTRWTVNKAYRKTEFLVFRIQKTQGATNWTMIAREINTDGQLVRFAASDIISATATLTPEDTLQERTTMLAVLDRSEANKIDDAKEEEKERKKAKKAKKATTATSLRSAPTPIRNSNLHDIALVREAIHAEITPLVTKLGDAVQRMAEAEDALKVCRAVFVDRLQTVATMAHDVAALARGH